MGFTFIYCVYSDILFRFICFERGQCQSCASKSQHYATESLVCDANVSERESAVSSSQLLEHLHFIDFELLAVYVLQIVDKI